MGLFSKLKKGVKGLFRGIKKVFKKAFRGVGKLLGSKWGKALLIAASIFTLGGALQAGMTAWKNVSGSMMDKFLAAGGDFTRSLVGMQTKYGGSSPIASASGVEATGVNLAQADQLVAGQTQALQAGLKGTPVTENLNTLDAALLGGKASPVGPSVATVPGQQISTKIGQLAKPGPFKQAAGSFMNFAKTPGGGLMIGNILGGVGEAMLLREEAQDARRYQRKLDREWRDWDWGDTELGATSDIGTSTTVGAPRSYQSRFRMTERN